MADTDLWFTRDLPTLREVAGVLEETSPNQPFVETYNLADRIGMDQDPMMRALLALEPEYLTIEWSFVDQSRSGMIRSLTTAGRRAVGFWPSPETLSAEFLGALGDEILESTGEKRTKFERLRDSLIDASGGVGSGALVAIFTRFIGG